MRSSLVVTASGCQCQSRNSPWSDLSIHRHSEIWGAADEAVLNNIHKIQIFFLKSPFAACRLKVLRPRSEQWIGPAVSSISLSRGGEIPVPPCGRDVDPSIRPYIGLRVIVWYHHRWHSPGEEGLRCNDFCFFGKKERTNIVALLSKNML